MTNTSLDFEFYLRKKAKFSAEILLSISKGNTGLIWSLNCHCLIGTAVLENVAGAKRLLPRPVLNLTLRHWKNSRTAMELWSFSWSSPASHLLLLPRKGYIELTCWPFPQIKGGAGLFSYIICRCQCKMGPLLKTRKKVLLGINTYKVFSFFQDLTLDLSWCFYLNVSLSKEKLKY